MSTRNRLTKTSMRALVISIASALLVSGCTPFVEVIKVDEQAARDLRSRIKKYPANSLAANQYKSLGSVSAISCKLNAWDPDSTPENATEQLLHKVDQKGGNAITNLVCDPREGTSLNKNCWNTVTCRGLAIRVTK